MRATDPATRKKVIDLYLRGGGRNENARLNNIGEATVTDILNRWKRDVDAAAATSDSDPMTVTDYESIRDLALYCKKEGVKVSDLRTALRMKNYITRLGCEEDQVEQLISGLSNSNSDPQRLIKVVDQIAQISDLSLPELEERIKTRQAELSTIRYEIERLKKEEQEIRELIATIDKDSFLELKGEMAKAGIEPTDSPRFLSVIHTFRKYGYDPSKIMDAFAEVIEVRDVKRLKQETNNNQRTFDTMLSTLGLGDFEQLKKVIVALMTLENFGVGVEQIVGIARSFDLDRVRRQQWERHAQGRKWGDRDIPENNGGQYAGYPF